MRTWSVVIASRCSTNNLDQSAASSGASGAFSRVRLSGTGSAAGALYCGGAGFVCAAALNAAIARNTDTAITFIEGSCMLGILTSREMLGREKRFRISLPAGLINHEPRHRDTILLLQGSIDAVRFGINRDTVHRVGHSHISQLAIVLRIFLLKHGNYPAVARHVDSVERRIEFHHVRAAGQWQVSD